MKVGLQQSQIISSFEIIATNIKGTTIEGKTIQSDKSADYGTPAYGSRKWCLDNTGSGHLASGNISWTADGNVTFGPGVELSWTDNIKHKPTIPSQSAVEGWATTITNNALKAYNITANQIKGLTIEGNTFRSSVNAASTSPAGASNKKWQLNDSGAGWLASGNISWDAGGKVTFGPGVSLSWNSIKDAVEDNYTPENAGLSEDGLSENCYNALGTQ